MLSSASAISFQTLFESVPGLYLVLRRDLTIAAANDAYLAATMTRRDAIVGRHIFEAFPDNPADPDATGVANLRASLERVLATGRPDAMAVQKYDVRRPQSQGGQFEERYWSPLNVPVPGADGAVHYILHSVQDVTEFMRLQAGQREHQAVTDQLRTRTGQMEAEIVRRGRQLQDANQQLRVLHEQLEARVTQRTAELAARTSELEESNRRLRHEVEERRQAEQALRDSEDQLRQAQKLEAVGRLAGGVAHDFNNLLSVILSYAELLLDEQETTPSTRQAMLEIQRAGNRAASLTRQLLAFSRQQVFDLRLIDLNDVLGGVATLARLLGEDIELKVVPSPAPCTVRADRTQLDQVILNLVINARDAMLNGGKLTIGTAPVELDEEYTRQHVGVIAGSYAVLSVSDTGIGMDKATQARAFEPFFTTKDKSRGTGLGLSTVFGIVKQSGGHIWLYSEPGVGTTFRIYFPRVESVAEVARDAAPVPASGGDETILLVEDETQVRQVAMAILQQLGYHVLEAETPEQALEHCARFRGRIDLLLTDVVMPRLSGRQVADRISILRPGVAVLYMSGYTDDAMLHHGVIESGAAFVQKPLTPTALARKVRDVIDRRG